MQLRPEHKLSIVADALRSAHAVISGDHSPVARFRTIVWSNLIAQSLIRTLDKDPVDHLIDTWLHDASTTRLTTRPASERLDVMRRCIAEGVAPDLASARAMLVRASATTSISETFDRVHAVAISRDAAVNHLHPMIHTLELSTSATTDLTTWIANTSQDCRKATTLLVASTGPNLWAGRWLQPFHKGIVSRFGLTDAFCISCTRVDSLLKMVEPVPPRRSGVTIGHNAPQVFITFVGQLGHVKIGLLDDASLISIGSNDQGEPWFRRGWCLTQIASRSDL